MHKKIEKSPDQKTMSNETIQIHRLCRLDIFHFLDRCEMERLYLLCKQIAVVLKTHFHTGCAEANFLWGGTTK